MKIKYKQHTVKLDAGTNNGSQSLATIHGKVIGWATVPSDSEINADIILKDGANAVLEEIDVRVGSILKANNFINSVVPLTINNPGQLRAEIFANETLVTDYEVKIIVFYVEDENLTLKDCI